MGEENHMEHKKKTPRQVAGEKLLAVYATLAPSKRELLQQTLLEHAYLSKGDAYIKWADRNEYARGAAYFQLMDVTKDVADAWFHWAAAIEMEGLSARTVSEVIFGLVGEFVWFRFLERIPSWAPVKVGLEAPLQIQ
jgi:hypothetical protein